MDRRVTLLLFLSLLFSGAKASVVSLSLKESEQRFSEHNLEVIAERYNIDIAEAQVVQAKLFENPVVSLEQNVYNRLNGRYFDFGKQGETIVEVNLFTIVRLIHWLICWWFSRSRMRKGMFLY